MTHLRIYGSYPIPPTPTRHLAPHKPPAEKQHFGLLGSVWYLLSDNLCEFYVLNSLKFDVASHFTCKSCVLAVELRAPLYCICGQEDEINALHTAGAYHAKKQKTDFTINLV